MELNESYTGIAIPVNYKGEDILIAVRQYSDVGMYSTCLKMENGQAIALGLGGFREETAFTPLDPTAHYPVYQTTPL